MGSSKKDKANLAEKIKRIRINVAKMTQSEFAETLGITRTYVCQLENPNFPKYPSTDLLRRISDLYQIDYEYLTTSHKFFPEFDSGMEMIMKKMSEEVLFTSDTENISVPLQILARNYYRLMEDRLIEGISPENMDQETYKNYAYAFYNLFQTLCQTMGTLRQELKESGVFSPDLFEEYLQSVQSQKDIFTREEKDTK
ncbi:MAG: helix-turn-helix domain-containing protein [Blautia hansenii]